MTQNIPLNEALRRKDGVIDQRQQQIDPAAKHRDDPNEAGPKRSQKQPGQDLRDPQDEPTDGKCPQGRQGKARYPTRPSECPGRP